MLAKIGTIKPLTETDYKRLVKAMGERQPSGGKTSHYARDIISKHLDNEGSVVRKTILENLGYKSSDNIAGAKDYIKELLKNQVFRTSVISQYQKMKPLYPGKTMAELLIHSVVDTLKQHPLKKPIKKSRPKGTLND